MLFCEAGGEVENTDRYLKRLLYFFEQLFYNASRDGAPCITANKLMAPTIHKMNMLFCYVLMNSRCLFVVTNHH